MKFEHPEVFYALIALVIPVLVHLFNFRRYRQVVFSNVQFLKEVQQQQASRTHLRQRLVLAARLLTLFFLILAFAKPYLTGKSSGPAGGEAQVVSVFVDNSYSMQTLNREGSLLDEAKRRAKEVVAAYGLNDRFQLLTHDFEGRHQRLLTAAEFGAAVDTVKLSAQSRTLQQIINRQQGLFSLQPQAQNSSYIISDFQHNLSNRKPLQLDNDININFVPVKPAILPNLAVDSVVMLNAVHRAGAQEKAVLWFHNYADKKAQAVPFKLIINGVQKALGSATVKANSALSDTLTFSGLQAGWQQAEVQLQDNPVTFDNSFYFTFQVQKQLPVLVINESVPDIYLAAAFHTDAFFKTTQVMAGNVNYSALSKYPVVMLSNAKAVSAGLSQQLKAYVNQGGTLVVFPANEADLAGYRALLQPLGASWPQKLVTEPLKVSSLNLKHPALRGIFDEMPQNPELPAVKKYYQLSDPLGKSSHLMDLPSQTPFFTGYNSDKGKVYVSAVPLNQEYSNLPRHALLLPLLFRIALLSNNDLTLYYTIGRDESMTLPPITVSEKQLLYLTNGHHRLIPDVRNSNGVTRLFVADEIRRAGIYQFKNKDSLVAAIAFNGNRSESDLHYLSNTALNRLLPKNGKLITPGSGPVTSKLKDANKGLQLWKVSLILALIFIAAEIALIRYLKAGKVSQSST
ncbi:BatA and WFA domain-containing protein [Mucilaginibacter koreensis]